MSCNVFCIDLWITIIKSVSCVAQCAESLARIQAGLTNTANKRERVKILHKKSESHAVLDQSELITGLFYSSISAYGYF